VTIKIESNFGAVSPFKRVTLDNPVACRFCESKAKGRRLKGAERMQKGEQAVRLTTTSGPGGRAFVCIPHADQLLENLAEELDKEPQGEDTEEQ